MKLMLNLSVEPFFVAMADQQGNIAWQQELSNTKHTGKEVFEVLEKHQEDLNSLDWVGGVTGPGGFATLRLAASCLNTLAYRYKIPVRQVRADDWIRDWMKDQEYQGFYLNSFGDKVFEGNKKTLEVVSLSDIKPKELFWGGGLPQNKSELLNTPTTQQLRRTGKCVQKKVTTESLYQVLAGAKDEKTFVPDYMFEAV